MANIISGGINPNLGSDLSGALSAGDSLYIGQGSVEYNVAGANDISGTDLARIELQPGWLGDFASGVPLIAKCDRTSTGILLIKWSGRKSYIKSASAATVIYRVEMEPSKGGIIDYSSADTEIFLQRSGTLLAQSTADISKFYAGGSAVGHLLESGPTVAECVAGGNSMVHLSRAATLINVGDQARVKVLKNSITPTNVYMYGNGAALEYMGGNITNLYLYGGVLDLRNLPAPITVTNRYAYLPTTILVNPSGAGEPTWTNKPIDYNPPRISYG